MNTLVTIALILVGSVLAFGDKLKPVLAWLKSLIGKPATASREKALAGHSDVAAYLHEIGDTDCQTHLDAVWTHLGPKV